MAASRKEEKYTEVDARHVFQPIAMETLGVFSSSANSLAVWATEFPPAQARLRRDMFSLPENLGVVAELQRCPTPRLLAGIRLRGLSIVPIC